MDCPFCRQPDTKVIDTRHVTESNSVRRRRECEQCAKRFTTYEKAELNMPTIIKTDGRRVKFEEEKLRKGIQRACEKRPVGIEQIEAVIDLVKNRLRELAKREVNSKVVGEWVMEALAELDPVAYVRFASVYRQFEDLDAFRDEIQKLKSRSLFAEEVK
jgi:transcriptional repressor NrdR